MGNTADFSVDRDESHFLIVITFPGKLSVERCEKVIGYINTNYGKELRRCDFMGGKKLLLTTKSNRDSFKIMEAYALRLSL